MPDLPRPRTALVLGATGLIGSALTSLLLADTAYNRVSVLARRALPYTHPRLQQRVADLARMAEQSEIFAGADLFCCLGTTIRKAGSQAAFRTVDHDYPLEAARLALQEGARQYFLVTAMGADPRSSIFYNRVKGEVEEAIRSLGLPALHIFRPSLLLGRREESRPGEAVASAVMRPLAFLFAGPLRRYRPIEGSAVAEAMRRVACSDTPGTHIYESDRIAAIAAQ